MENIAIGVRNLKKHYDINRGMFKGKAILRAVDDISFELYRGETLGIVGESGCGKSTTGKMILKIEEPSSGEIVYKGKDIKDFYKKELKDYRKNIQIVFQDPYSSLNPRWRICDIIAEPIKLNTKLGSRKLENKVLELMKKVGLNEESYLRYPHQFSGGQRQRIGLARAIALNPEIIICDEPVSALDVSIQAQVINLLMELQRELKLTYIFISHDLGVVRYISDRVIVMYMGKIVEIGTSKNLFNNPKHPYTIALLDSIPDINISEKKERMLLEGDIPTPINPPSGCRFRSRCVYAKKECKQVDMKLVEIEDGHKTACPFFM